MAETQPALICPGSLVVFGATSGIAEAFAAECLQCKQPIILVGRTERELQRLATDFEIRYRVKPPYFVWDISQKESHAERMQALLKAHEVGGILLCAGILHTEEAIQSQPELARNVIDIDLTESIQILLCFAAHLRGRREGLIAAISSVAGDRGRAKHATYGAAKAGLNVFLAGLRLEMRDYGVGVCTIKPGPVRTRMTADYQGSKALLAHPKKVAKRIFWALQHQKAVTYTPAYWRWVMLILRMLPEPFFAKIKA